MTSQARILALLIRARKGDYYETVDNGRLRIPDGWLPLFSLQGKDAGRTAANCRLAPRKCPQAASKKHKGVPIEKMLFEYTDSYGRPHYLPVYRLAIEPRDLDRFLHPDTCSLNRTAVEAAGFRVEEYIEESTGGKPNPAVRLVKRDRLATQSSLFA